MPRARLTRRLRLVGVGEPGNGILRAVRLAPNDGGSRGRARSGLVYHLNSKDFSDYNFSLCQSAIETNREKDDRQCQ
jgi:hypothetical protein